MRVASGKYWSRLNNCIVLIGQRAGNSESLASKSESGVVVKLPLGGPVPF